MAMQSQVNYVTDQAPELDDELILRNTDLLTLTDGHKVSRSTLVKHHSCCKEKSKSLQRNWRKYVECRRANVRKNGIVRRRIMPVKHGM